MVIAATDLRKPRQQSVQDIPDAKTEGAMSSFWWGATQRGYHLPAWGTRERERVLRMWYRHEYNWMGRSAISGILKAVASSPWKIKGKRKTAYFQDVFRYANFSVTGNGWRDLIMKTGQDYFRQDGGGWIELIAPGRPDKAPTGAITGLASLDSLQCVPTGDPEYPILYWSRLGKMHLMHSTRVLHLLDTPDGDERVPGYGDCAQSRAMAIVIRQIWENRYVEAKLDDQPAPGFMVGTNINRGEFDRAMAQYQLEQNQDERPVWGRNVRIYSNDPAYPAKLEQITLSQAPEQWSFREYTELDANAWALALGVDVQELWQLTGGRLGSAEQSEMLHAKSRGKTIGDFLTLLERSLNDVLPDYLTFEFEVRDPYEEASSAQTATLWAGFASDVASTLSGDEQRRLLASTVPAYRDIVTDPSGAVISLNDLDVQPEAVDTGETPPEPMADTTAPVNATDTTALAAKDIAEAELVSHKSIQATRLDFELDFEEALTIYRAKGISSRGYAAIMRQLVSKFGLLAMKDGLIEGGITDGVLDEDDQAAYTALLAEHNRYIKDYVASAQDLSDAEAARKPAMWYVKTISAFESAGRLSADKNGYYQFLGDDGVESCKTCKKLKTQIHRFKDWSRKKLRPGVDTENFECSGFECKHRLVKVPAGSRASGHWLR